MNRVIHVIIICMLLSCNANHSKQHEELPFYNSVDFTPEFISPNSAEYDNIHTVGDFSFTNQLGEKVDQNTIEDKILVTNFFFTICPSICPTMTANLDLVFQEFKNDDDVIMISHTVMPWVDSVARLKEYADFKGIQASKWHLVTGDKDELYNMGRENYFVDEDYNKNQSGADEFLHTENIILVDKKRRIRGVYRGTYKNEIQKLIEDLHILQSSGEFM